MKVISKTNYIVSFVLIVCFSIIFVAAAADDLPDNLKGDNYITEYSDEQLVESAVAGPDDTEQIFTPGDIAGQVHIDEEGNLWPLDLGQSRAGWEHGKISPEVTERAMYEDQIRVIVQLKDRPIHRVAKEVGKKREAKIEKLAGEIRKMAFLKMPKGNFKNAENEKLQMQNVVFSRAEKNAIQSLNKKIDDELNSKKKEIGMQVKDAVKSHQRQITELIESLGGEVVAKIPIINAIGAIIPSSALDAIAQNPLVDIIELDSPCALDLDDSACMLGASSWWNNGENGGAYDAAVIDNGIREDHVYLKYKSPPSSDPRNIYKKTPGYDTGPYIGHGTQTAGVIASTRSTYKGIAFGLDKLFDARSSATESISMESIDWTLDCPLTIDAPEVINCSFSLYAHNDEFGVFERFMDAVIHDLDVMVTKSAGNAGLTELGYPQSRNLMSVANLDIKDTCPKTDDVIRSSSSRGPTDSGRRKPDITAPGQNTWAPDVGSTTDFDNHGGTSAAAPHVAGAILLLQDGGVYNPRIQKAILINTADTWSDNDTLSTYTDDGPVAGDRWDETYGWGVMDLSHAYFHRNDYFYDSVIARNGNAVDDDYKLYKGLMFADDKATLVWHRRAVYNGSAEPTVYYTLTDLNLRLYDENTGTSVDYDTIHSGNNVHQVSSNSLRDVVIKVYSYSTTIYGASSEYYALATEENFEKADPPSFTITLSMPSAVYYSTDFLVTATVYNTGDVTAHNCNVTLNLPSGFSLISGTNPQNVGDIQAGQFAQASWTVRSSAGGGTYTISTDVSSSCYLETYTGDKQQNIEVGPSALPNLTDVTPSGWSYPIVPRNTDNATSTWCPLSSTLPGDTNDAYYNWAWINDGASNAGSHKTAVYLDGEFLFSSTRTLSSGATAMHRNIPSWRAISGGRHTLHYMIDTDGDVLENNEGDNCWGRQFIWSPYALLDDVPVTRSAPPDADAWGCTPGLKWYNNDGFSFYVGAEHPDKLWSAVGILPSNSTSDYSLRLWDRGDYTGSEGGFGLGYLQWSKYPSGQSEFVIVNNNKAVAGTYYAGVINDNDGTADFRIEEDTTVKVYPRPGTQWNGPFVKGPTNVLDIYEVYLTAGEYYFYLDQTAGNCNLGMSLYDNDTVNCKKSDYIAGAYADDTGDVGDEQFQVTIPENGFYGLVVWKVDSSDYDRVSTYRIAIGAPQITVISPNGGETFNVGQTVNITWEPFGNIDDDLKIEISRDGGSGWSVISPDTKNDGSFTWVVTLPGSEHCLVKITSLIDPTYTDTSDSKFTVDASGIPPEINLREDATNIPDGGKFSFGNVNIGWSRTVTFTIENLGGADLDLTGLPPVQISGPNHASFVVTSQPSTPISSLDSTTFDIKFTPDELDSFYATVSIPNTDSDENPYVFGLYAKGSLVRTLYVDDDAPNDPGPGDPSVSDPKEDGSEEHPFDMIQEAIDEAFHGDTVIVLPGTYWENINLLGKNITVKSTDPNNPSIVDDTVITAKGKGTIVTFNSGEDSSCHLTGFTLTDGAGTDVKFVGTDVLAGGAVLSINSSPTVSKCALVYNTAELGGAVYGSNSGMILSHCSIVKNIATTYHGGGFYFANGSKPRIEDSSIWSNIAKSAGGAISAQSSSDVIVTGNKIYGNEAKSGGALAISNSGKTKIINNVIYNNSSIGTGNVKLYDGGGAITLWGAPILCENCTFYGNSAVVEGGAVRCAYTKDAVFKNCIFWANSAPKGPTLYLRYTQGSTSYPSIVDMSYNDVQNELAGIVVEGGCTLNYDKTNFDADPLFASTGGADFHLKSKYGRWNPSTETWVYDGETSKCIDAGDPASDWTAELWPHGKTINVGAYGNTPEASMSWSALGNICDLNNDGKVDWQDIQVFCSRWLDEDLLIPENINRTGAVEFTDFAICGNNWFWEEP